MTDPRIDIITREVLTWLGSSGTITGPRNLAESIVAALDAADEPETLGWAVVLPVDNGWVCVNERLHLARGDAEQRALVETFAAAHYDLRVARVVAEK